MKKISYTRQDYLDGKCSHGQYYAQFVTERVLASVHEYIGVKDILASTDEHFNDVRLSRWDNLNCTGKEECDLLHQAGDFLSLATNCCIAKQAAKMIKDTLTA